MTTPCRHDWIRYILTDHKGADGVDDRGRPYRDICMKPKEVLQYTAAIGSNFEARVIEAVCANCAVAMLMDREEAS